MSVETRCVSTSSDYVITMDIVPSDLQVAAFSESLGDNVSFLSDFFPFSFCANKRRGYAIQWRRRDGRGRIPLGERPESRRSPFGRARNRRPCGGRNCTPRLSYRSYETSRVGECVSVLKCAPPDVFHACACGASARMLLYICARNLRHMSYICLTTVIPSFSLSLSIIKRVSSETYRRRLYIFRV